MRVLCLVSLLVAHGGQDLVPLVAEEVFKGTVASVEDGDSVVVKTATEQVTVHIAGADAPELSQPGGPEAKVFLTGLALGKAVTVRLKSSAGRLGRIDVGGTDVSTALIRSGMAWHCPRYGDERELTRAEADARSAKRGLWNRAQPTPPWVHRGAGACWEEKKGGGSVRERRPDFSGTWTAVSPSDRAGQKLIIRQDAVNVSLERVWERNEPPLVYRLEGPTSRALHGPDGPVDIVAKSRWSGGALIVEERQWLVRGEEPVNIRHTLWLDDRGLLNFEVASPRPIGEYDVTRVVLKKASP